MKLFRIKVFIFFILFGSTVVLNGQVTGFDHFISKISTDYKVDIAFAPELIPSLDSIRNFGPAITNIEDLLHRLLHNTGISYQIVDGNKLMLRREYTNEIATGTKLLKGTIVDSRDESPLAYAAVSQVETNRGSFTDEKGNFTLSVSDTSGSVVVNYLGFKPVTIPVQSFNGKMQIVKMELTSIPLKQVVIVVPFHQMTFDPQAQSIDLKGYQFITPDELLRGNTDQLINNLTGYTHYSSEEGIRIRGSAPENTLVLMDELPVYDPYHFYNIFSAFNDHYFSNLELYKNNMPVEYGGRIDGLISVDSDHDRPGSQLILDTDLLLSSIAGDWAASDKVRITGGARVSHTSMLNDALSDSTVSNFSKPGKFKGDNEWSSTQQPTFNFYDINLGVRAAIGQQSSLMVSYFMNKDHLQNTTNTAFEFMDHGNEINTVSQSFKSEDKWSNGGLSFDFQSPFQNNSKLNLTGFISSFDKSSAYTSSDEEFMHNMSHVDHNSGYADSHLNTAGIKTFISNDAPGNLGYKLGVDFQHHQVDLVANENTLPYLTQAQQETEATLFGEIHETLFQRLSLTLGGRMTYLHSTSRIYPLPHVQLNYLISDHFSLKSAFSKNIQTIQQITVENRFGREVDFQALSQPEAGYPVLKSDKYMAGATYTSNHFSVDGEFYYKKIDGLADVRALRPDPSFHNETPPGDFYELFTGDGWTAGMDWVMAYKIKNFDGSVSYTLSKITERFDKLFNGNSYSPQEDRRHQVKLSLQYKIGKFIATSLLTYKSKAPYLSYVRLEGRDGIGMVDQGNVFRYLPPYFSLDLGLDYSFKCFHHPALVGISLINATNHENINDLQHTGMVSRDEGMHGLYLTQETELLGRTFNVHVRYLLN